MSLVAHVRLLRALKLNQKDKQDPPVENQTANEFKNEVVLFSEKPIFLLCMHPRYLAEFQEGEERNAASAAAGEAYKVTVSTHRHRHRHRHGHRHR